MKQDFAKLESQWKHYLEYMSGMVNTSRTQWIMFEKQNAQFVIKHQSQI